MDETKSFLLSKTLIGVAVMLVSYFFGEDLGKLAGQGIEVAQGVATSGLLAGVVLATIGRFTVKKGISVLPKVPDKRGSPYLTPKPNPVDYATIDPPSESKRATRRK